MIQEYDRVIPFFFFFNLGNVAVYESVTQMEDTGEGTIYILNIKEQFEM